MWPSLLSNLALHERQSKGGLALHEGEAFMINLVLREQQSSRERLESQVYLG